MKQMSLAELLKCCTDRNSGCWENGWREFMRRYQDFIRKSVKYNGFSIQSQRLNKQRYDAEEDAIAEVLMILMKSLHTFYEHDNEKIFRAWLATVIRRATRSWILKEVVGKFIDKEITDFETLFAELDAFSKYEFYEYMVFLLRSGQKYKSQKIERNIHIFMLNTWMSLSKPTIMGHPCFKEIQQEHFIEVIVNRMRKRLRDSEDLIY